MSKRRQMTAADYAAMAICPSLIVLMLAALMHFVILCVYQGEYSGRLTYILFMFIMGATGIARISIEEGRGYASFYAGALGLAVVFVLGIQSIFLLGLIWFLADRITFDCTVIDDGQDASGEGLIESGGLFGGKRPQESTDVSLDGTTEQPLQQKDAEDVSTRSRKKKRKTHKPGKTVFYLALAALPLFGLGQFFLPPREDVRGQAALALGLYLFATLTLLVVTSFLGLRRYLRQRGAEMPANVAIAWIGGGAVLTAVMLIACFALPMPGHMLAVAELPKIESLDWLSSSRFGWGKEGVKNGSEQDPDDARVTDPSSENEPGSQTDEQGQPGGAPEDSSSKSEPGAAPGGEKTGDGGSSSGEQSDSDSKGAQGDTANQSEQSGSEGQSETQSSEAGSSTDEPSQNGSDGASGNKDGEADQEPASQAGEDETQAAESSSGEASSRSPGDSREASEPSTSEPSSSTFSLPNIFPAVGPLFKMLIVLGLLAVIVIFLLKNPHLWRQWLDALADFFQRSERTSSASGGSEPDPLAQVAYRSFGSFQNPLGEGGDPRRAVVVSFQAFDAWAREQGDPRHDDETPAEFATRFSRHHPSFGSSLPRLADAYNRTVYGRSNPTKKDLDAAASVWKQMTSAPHEVSPTMP